MAKGKRWARMLAGVAVLALVGAACGDDGGGDGDRSAAAGLTGSITISGSSTVEPISSLVAQLFNETNPEVEISVDGPGTGDGFELFCQGEIEIADASRQIDDEEVAACEDGGIAFTELEVAFDGITVMVNADERARVPHDRRTSTRSSVRTPTGVDSTGQANTHLGAGRRRRHHARPGAGDHRTG